MDMILIASFFGKSSGCKILFLFLLGTAFYETGAQEPKESNKPAVRTNSTKQQELEFSYYQDIRQYDPNTNNPYGSLNPSAAEEVKQFEFLIGECHCVDSLRTQKGWITFPSYWRGEYFMNGMAIQDRYYNPKRVTSNLRFFDPNTGTWKVTFFEQPGYYTGTWEGSKERKNIVLKQRQFSQKHQDSAVSRLTFYNISPKGFSWKSELVLRNGVVQLGWKQQCKKVRGGIEMPPEDK